MNALMQERDEEYGKRVAIPRNVFGMNDIISE
jgi:hypothetical protein